MPRRKKLYGLEVQLHFLATRTFEARLTRAEKRSGRRRSDILRDGALREIETIERTSSRQLPDIDEVEAQDPVDEMPIEIEIQLPEATPAPVVAPATTEVPPAMELGEKVALVGAGVVIGAGGKTIYDASQKSACEPQPGSPIDMFLRDEIRR